MITKEAFLARVSSRLDKRAFEMEELHADFHNLVSGGYDSSDYDSPDYGGSDVNFHEVFVDNFSLGINVGPTFADSFSQTSPPSR